MKDRYLIDGHKMQYHAARVAQWENAKNIEDRLAVYPIYIEISPVGHCNHRCSFCAVDYIGYKPNSIDKTVLIQRISEMSRKGVKSIMFAGEGEPLLHKDIDEIVFYSHLSNIDVSFTTNGVLLNKLTDVLDKIKWIKVSMNGGPKTYATIHKAKEDDYERVWANLKAACEQRSVHTKNGNSSCTIGIQCVVLPENTQDLPELARRAKDTGLDYIVLKPYSQHKSSITHQYEGTNYAAYNDLITDLQKLNSPSFSVIARTTAMADSDAGEHHYSKCYSTPYFWAYIMATGDVYSCSAYLLNPDFNLGNINTSSFPEIWEGSKRRKHIVDMESLDISKCRLNCRMNQVNKYLDDIKQGNAHANFI